MRTYNGIRVDGAEFDAGSFAYVYTGELGKPGGSPLSPRLGLRNHSPTGFEWGYGGSGPAQLALAIVFDHYYVTRALRLEEAEAATRQAYQAFKFAVVAEFEHDGWMLTADQVDRALRQIEGRPLAAYLRDRGQV